MPKEQYDRPRGISFGVSRTFDLVAVPWLQTGKRALSAEDAELICGVCHLPEKLTHEGFKYYAQRFAGLLRDHPAEVGELINLVGTWGAKQAKSKTGRARRVIEVAMTRRPGAVLSPELLRLVAKEEDIDLSDVGPAYLRGRINDIRREVEAMAKNTPRMTDAQIDAQLAAQRPLVQNKVRK